ncbi:MAG: FtsX-like permease family protein, partial [Eubacteriales bacterium]|nr:FtsX-like permease family protein [Eubacteriales bacterium]
MFFLVLRKIWNNKWLMACLLIGSILAVAMVASIPLYTDGILQRMIVKDMEAYQQRTGYYSGRYLARYIDQVVGQDKDRVATYNYFDEFFENKAMQQLGLTTISKTKRLGMDFMKTLPVGAPDTDVTYTGLYAMEGFEDNIDLVAGQMPAAAAVDGVYEVLISSAGQDNYKLRVGTVYQLSDTTRQMESILVKPVGIYRQRDNGNAWWYDARSRIDNGMVMGYDLFVSDIVVARHAITSGEWYFAIDYNSIKIDELAAVNQTIKDQISWFTKFAGTEMNFPAITVLDEYASRESQLRTTLWVLQAPILILLAFYMFMVSQLIVENDRNEIAVIKSRGASGSQVFQKYLLQSAILSVISVVLGPLLAFGICRVLGASNGFLEFVGRTALPLQIRPRTVLYAVVAGCFTVVMMMIPAMRATRTTVVEHKQKSARRWSAPLWQKFFLDFVLLALSIYGLYNYQNRQQTILVTGATGVDVPLDPFLFIISTLFILGAGLLFLRIYPYVIRFISWAGRKIWSPVLYTSFIQVGRSSGREQFLMLFLVFTIGIGVFSANSARTINQNIEDRAGYEVGADIAVQMLWPGDEKSYGADGGASQGSVPASQLVTQYTEPSFDQYANLKGTQYAAKVLRITDAVMSAGDGSRRLSGALMAIDPYEFGHVVWYRDGLLPHHINEYLNLLGSEPSAVLISRRYAQDAGVAVGDYIEYRWGNQTFLEGVVYAIVDYWPTLNPYTERSKYFVVANLDYVQAQTALSPYQIWYKKSPGATSNEVYADMQERSMLLQTLNDLSVDVAQAKNDPLLQGTNGAMTLGFAVTLGISMIGFIIYWILSIQARTLQFGILRAMGMSGQKVMGMLAFEQLLISGVAIFVGLL